MRFILLLLFVFPLALLGGCDCAPAEEPSGEVQEPADADAALVDPSDDAMAEDEGSSAAGEGAEAAPNGADSEAATAGERAAPGAEAGQGMAADAASRGRVQPGYRVQSQSGNLRLRRADGAQELSMPSLSLGQYEERTQRREQQLAPPRLDFDPGTLQLRPEIADQLERARQAD